MNIFGIIGWKNSGKTAERVFKKYMYYSIIVQCSEFSMYFVVYSEQC